MSENSRTLVAYMSNGGVTQEYAEIIADVLREKYGHKVDLLDIKKNKKPDTSKYDNFIIGSGVRMQRVYKKGLEFMKNDFGDKKVAIYISSNEAGTEKSYPDAVKKYMTPIKEKNPHLNLVAIEGFGGRIKMLGKTTVDLRDPEKVKQWTDALAEKLQ